MDLFDAYANLFNGKMLFNAEEYAQAARELEYEKECVYEQEMAYIQAERACMQVEPDIEPAINVDMGYLLSGNAVFTVDNGKGESYRYRVVQTKNKYFVSLLNGAHSTYMALWTLGKPLYFGGKTRFTADSKQAKVFEWALKVLQGMAKLPEGYSILR